MAMTDDTQMDSAADQYKDAFNEANGTGESTGGGDSFGITPPEEAVAAAAANGTDGGPGTGDAGTETEPGEPTETSEMANSEASTAPTDEGLHGEMPVGDSEPEPGQEPEAMTEQQLKSWAGRLRKMEADLKAKSGPTETAAAEALEVGAEKAEDMGNPEMGDAMEVAAEKVEDGSMTVEQAMKSLAEDFGEPFVKMIEAIASAKAGEIGASAVAKVDSEVKEIIAHISDSNERSHFERIEAAHSDFNDLRQDPAFLEFVSADPANQQVAAQGSAADVIKLIQTFKDQAPKQDSGDTPAPEPVAAEQASDDPEGPDVDAATGVRSGGMSIPDKPAQSDDYEGAFAEATRR